MTSKLTGLTSKSTKPRTQTSAPLTRAEFRARLAARMKHGEVPGETLDPNIFDSWEEAEDLVKHYKAAPVEPLGHRDIAGSRRRAKVRRRTVVRTSRARVHAAARKPKTRKAETKVPVARHVAPARVKTGASKSPTRVPSTMAQLVRPGLSLGPPKRFIGLRFITPDIDVSEAKFRRQRVGIGKVHRRQAQGRPPCLCIRLRDARIREAGGPCDQTQPDGRPSALACLHGERSVCALLLVLERITRSRRRCECCTRSTTC